MFVPEIDQIKCIGCGECTDICPNEVFELIEVKAAVVNAEECLGCESCIEVSEQGAVTVEEILAYWVWIKGHRYGFFG